MSGKVDNWVKGKAEGFLRRIGLREGDRVLDFGARNGAYHYNATKAQESWMKQPMAWSGGMVPRGGHGHGRRHDSEDSPRLDCLPEGV